MPIGGFRLLVLSVPCAIYTAFDVPEVQCGILVYSCRLESHTIVMFVVISYLEIDYIIRLSISTMIIIMNIITVVR